MPVGDEGIAKDQRRQKHEEHQIRREADGRHARHERESDAAEQEHDRVGLTGPLRDDGENRDRRQHEKNLQLVQGFGNR
jgi:hypothetical protein